MRKISKAAAQLNLVSMFLTFVLLGVSQALARPLKCESIFSGPSLAKPASEGGRVAKEIEVNRTHEITALLQPKSSLLSELLSPEELNIIAARNGFSASSPMRFSDLTPKAQVEIFYLVGLHVNFAKDRTLPRFSAAREISFTPSQTITFRGQVYPQGVPAKVSLDGFLMPKVEYGSGSSVKTAAYLEFHFRGDDPVTLDQDIRVFFKEIVRAEPSSDHVHTVSRRPKNLIEKMRRQGLSDQEIASLLASYHSIMETNVLFLVAKEIGYGSIQESFAAPGAPPVMSFLQKKKIPELLRFYEALVEGRSLDIDRYGEVGTNLKKNYVGARWGSTYTDPSLFGLEFRAPNYGFGKALAPLAATAKKVLDDELFNFSEGDILQIRNDLRSGQLEKSLAVSGSVTENAEAFQDPALKEKAMRIASQNSRAFVHEAQPGLFVYPVELLVVFDWSSHPLLKRNAELVKRIQATQHRFFDEIIQKGLYRIDLGRFLKESGLEEAFQKMSQGRSVTEEKPQAPSPQESTTPKAPSVPQAPFVWKRQTTVPTKFEIETSDYELVSPRNLEPYLNHVTTVRATLLKNFSLRPKIEIKMGASSSAAQYSGNTMLVAGKMNETLRTPQQMVATSLHELGHFVFLDTMVQLSPTWKWIANRLNTRGMTEYHLALHLKQEGVANPEARAAQIETERDRSLSYQELFCDLVAVAALREPKIFEESLGSPLRSFDGPIANTAWRKLPPADPYYHDALGPTRSFLWRFYFSKANDMEESRVLIERVFEIIAAELRAQEGGPLLDARTQNARLIARFRQNLGPPTE